MRASSRAMLVSVSVLGCSATPLHASQPTSDTGNVPTASAPEPTVAPGITTTAEPTATAAPAEVARRAQGFVDAYRAMQAGRSDDAREGFARSVKQLPELADHALYHQARLALQAGDAEQARSAIERLVVEHPDSVWLADAAVDRGRIALADGKPEEAARWFERARDAADASTANAARLGLAQALSASGSYAAAYEIVDGLRGKPGSVGSEARTLGETLEARGAATLNVPPDELRLRIARARLREGRGAEAREILSPILTEDQALRGEAALIEARTYGKAAPAEASAAYEVAIRSSSTADVAGTALFERGKAAWNRDENDAADADFRIFIERFPSHQSAAEALAARARIAEGRGDVPGAIALYDQVSTSYPGTRFAEEAAFRAAFARYQKGDFAAAATAFAALGERDDARYWRARSLERSGDEDGARALYVALRDASPASSYAWWIDERIGPATTRPAYPRANEHAERVPVPPLSGVAAYHYGRGEVLTRIGLRRDAVREYAAIEAVIGPDPFLLDAYRDAAAWNQLVKTAIRLQQAGRQGVEGAVYPRPYAREFQDGATRAGVDPLLLVSMARQESLFDPQAVSSAGARGVLQLMPATAQVVAGQAVDTASLDDPAFNIDLGARYFDSVLERFDGRIVLAVASYNAGPEAVDRWLGRFPDASGDEFVERISYRETRDYVKAVLRNYRTYHLLYGDRELPKPRLY